MKANNMAIAQSGGPSMVINGSLIAWGQQLYFEIF